jgi:tetratricopeptide (TPR) repeat protein
LASILKQYGWFEEAGFPTESKRKRIIELLNEFPSLVVADDIDSLESENEDVIEFFSLQLPITRSKVLFTSRRTIFGMGGTTTHISGFKEPDAERFIHSRCQLMELDTNLFTKRIIGRIVKVCEGSPLYIEDLMRLIASVNSVEEAISLWEGKGGNEARRYALGRECELLSTIARQVLFAGCVCPTKVSFAEIEEVTGLSKENITGALQELQRLFLVMKPKLIEGEQRFEININIRSLVIEVYGNSEQFRRIEGAHKTISGEIEKGGRDIAGIIRQAIFLLRGDRFLESEQLLVKALEKFPNKPDLLGVLGFVYKSWKPARVIDAREKFLRAHQLKAPNKEMYEHWCKMEMKEKDWARAAEVAERAFKLMPRDKLLLYLGGYSRSRFARELRGALHFEKAQKEVISAKGLLQQALRAISDYKQPNLDADIYRALVLTLEQTGELEEMQHYFQKWKEAFPEDPYVASEWERIAKKFKIESSPL